jgi:hypothetical protein
LTQPSRDLVVLRVVRVTEVGTAGAHEVFESSCATGAVAVVLVALDVAAADVDLLPDALGEPTCLVLVLEQPVISVARTTTAANNHRWACKAPRRSHRYPQISMSTRAQREWTAEE